MAYGLENYTNIRTPDSDNPNGSIKDNPGNNTGTPFNEQVYQDVHQVLAKLLRLAGITASGIHENEYSGFQYIDALRTLFSRNGNIRYIEGAIASTVITPELNPVLAYTPLAQNGHVVSLSAPDDQACDRKIVTVSNQSPFSVSVVSLDGYPINFSTTGTTTVAVNNVKTFIFDGRKGPQWVSV